MVLIASEQKLLMMRPYQVYAVKHLVKCIHEDSGNGFIWHTTGSGKMLTSFKASTLLKDNPDTVKCLFVVDTAMRDSAFGKSEAISGGCERSEGHHGRPPRPALLQHP